MTDGHPIMLKIPTPTDQRICEIHVWIAIQADGGEGIMSADMYLGDGVLRHMPLMSSKLITARSMGKLALEIARKSIIDGKPIVVEMRIFSLKSGPA